MSPVAINYLACIARIPIQSNLDSISPGLAGPYILATV